MTSTPLPPASVARAGDRWRNLRTAAICGVLGLGLSVLTAGLTLEELADPPLPEQDLALGALLVLDLAVGAMALIVLAVAGRRPRVWAGVLIAITTTVSVFAVPAAVVIVVRAAASRAHRLLALVAAIVVVAAVVSDWIWSTALHIPPQPWWQVAGLVAVLFCVPVLIGVARGRRDAEIAALAEAAAAAQREHAALVRQREAEGREHEARLASTREAERTRIAREMHDSLAHHLSLIAVHAGVLEYRADLDPEAAREAAATVGSAARSANAELREVLGVLRTGQDTPSPQPDLGRLGELVTDGVTLLSAGPFAAEDVPAGTSRHAYRIVQEALTNARKHAPGQPVTVRLTGTPSSGVSIEVRNRLAAAEALGAGFGSGLGLAGMTERARLAGGWCRAGAERHAGAEGQAAAAGQEFVVTAWLPW